MKDEAKHPQAKLYPNEVVTLAVLYALKCTKHRASYRWFTANDREFFLTLPERTRLFRLFATHQHWADTFLAQPTTMGIADSYEIMPGSLHALTPIRELTVNLPAGARVFGDKGYNSAADEASIFEETGCALCRFVERT